MTVLLNIADPASSTRSIPSTCDGIGLVRTEFLFHRPGNLPDEEEQYTVYRRIVEWARGKPVTIRTLDAGGDKPIPGYTLQRREQSVSGRARRAPVAAASGRAGDPAARADPGGGARAR